MRLIRNEVLAAVLCVPFAVTASRGQASRAPDHPLVFGVTAAGYYGNPYENTLGLGGLAALERRLSGAISLRGSASVLRTVNTADDVTICRPAPDDGCLPRPLFPLWLATLEANGVVTPVPGIPVALVAGVGVSIASDARGAWRGAPPTGSGSQSQPVVRHGLELRLGSGPRAPRVQLTRLHFRPDPFSLEQVIGVTVLLRP